MISIKIIMSRSLILIIMTFFVLGCNDQLDVDFSDNNAIVGIPPASNDVVVYEFDSEARLPLVLSKPFTETITVVVAYSSNNATYGTHYTTTPAGVNGTEGEITVSIQPGQDAELKINPILEEAYTQDRSVSFEIKSITGGAYELDGDNSFDITIIEKPVLEVSESTLDFGKVATGEDAVLSFDVTGFGILEDIEVVGGGSFLVSTDNSNFEEEVTTSGSSTIYVKFAPNSEEAGAQNHTITIESSEAITKEVGVTGIEAVFSQLAYTSFEEPAAGATNVYNAPDGEDLPNNAGENSVDFISVGGEIGFNTSYVTGQEGGADDLIWGVTNVIDELGAYTLEAFDDGAQAYVSSDADGLAEIVFDEVDITGSLSAVVSIATYFVGSSWETDDEFKLIWRTVDGDEEILSLFSNGSEITNSPDGSGDSIVDQWYTSEAIISNRKAGRLVIQIGHNSGSEILFIDDIKISAVN